jgi:hypothetical protein
MIPFWQVPDVLDHAIQKPEYRDCCTILAACRLRFNGLDRVTAPTT